MSDEPRPHHRPALYADLTDVIDAAGGTSLGSRAEIASATAAAVVQAGRSGDADGGRFVDLADRVGIDTLAAVWRDADPVSLPGALWALYLLQQWCQADGAEVTRLWRAGEALAGADAAIAGVADYADDGDLRVLADAVLTGVYRGDLAVAFERAAAFFRVVAAGRRSDVDPDARRPGDARVEELAARNERTAQSLSRCAARWRADTLA